MSEEGIKNDDSTSKVDKDMCDLKMCSLKDILINHENKIENHEARLKTLEEYNIQAKISNEALQKQAYEQKALTLELDAKQRERADKESEKVDKQFERNQINLEKNQEINEKKFEKMELNTKAEFDKQNGMLATIIENNNSKEEKHSDMLKTIIASQTTNVENQTKKDSNRTEISTKRMALIIAFFVLLGQVIEHFWK